MAVFEKEDFTLNLGFLSFDGDLTDAGVQYAWGFCTEIVTQIAFFGKDGQFRAWWAMASKEALCFDHQQFFPKREGLLVKRSKDRKTMFAVKEKLVKQYEFVELN